LDVQQRKSTQTKLYYKFLFVFAQNQKIFFFTTFYKRCFVTLGQVSFYDTKVLCFSI
jgi:hypothetical protein